MKVYAQHMREDYVADIQVAIDGMPVYQDYKTQIAEFERIRRSFPLSKEKQTPVYSSKYKARKRSFKCVK